MAIGTSKGKMELFDLLEVNYSDGKFAKVVNDPNFRHVLHAECVSEILSIFENQSEMKLVDPLTFGSNNWSSWIIPRVMLYMLECRNADQFFEIAISLDEFNPPDFYPELHDPKSKEYKELHSFISEQCLMK